MPNIEIHIFLLVKRFTRFLLYEHRWVTLTSLNLPHDPPVGRTDIFSLVDSLFMARLRCTSSDQWQKTFKCIFAQNWLKWLEKEVALFSEMLGEKENKKQEIYN